MIDITTIKGETYSFDPDTERIFKGGYLLPSTEVEPVYSMPNSTGEPIFSGILMKTLNAILSLSGKVNPINDINEII